jgi:hypothetical protein
MSARQSKLLPELPLVTPQAAHLLISFMRTTFKMQGRIVAQKTAADDMSKVPVPKALRHLS